jgi:hypothetical protein
MEQLTRDSLVAALDEWVGARIAVRVVTDEDDLLCIFQGRLGARSAAREPAAFWPVGVPALDNGMEEPGIYLHPDLFQAAMAHEGGFVLELRQRDVTMNIRRLLARKP